MMSVSNGSGTEPVSTGGASTKRYEERHLSYRDSAAVPRNLDHIIQHLKPLLGDVYFVHPLPAENVVKIDLILFPPNDDRKDWTIVTAGMSDKRMTLPGSLSESERQSLQFAELAISLPPNAYSINSQGALSDDQIMSGPNAWVVGLLAILGHFPHDYGTWLGIGHSVPNGDPAEPYTSSVPFSGVVIAPVNRWPDAYQVMDTSDRQPVNFLSVVPVYAEEMDFLLDKGFDALFSELTNWGFNRMVDESRPNIGPILSALGSRE
jgi:hypothetical protein